MYRKADQLIVQHQHRKTSFELGYHKGNAKVNADLRYSVYSSCIQSEGGQLQYRIMLYSI